MTDQGNQQAELEELIFGHFDGNLSVVQERELANAIAESPESKRLFLSHMRMEGRLHSVGRDGFFSAVDVQSETTQVEETLTARPGHHQSGSSRSRFWAKSSSIAICAMLMVMVGWGLWPSSVDASSVLQKAKQAAAELVDRAYRVTLVSSDAENKAKDQELMIHIRGENLFVIQPTDGSYLMGRDGNDYWMTARSGPVFVTENYRTLAPELRRKIPNRRLLGLAASPNEPLMLQVPSLLSLIETSYDIQLMASPNPSENHIRAISRTRRTNRPNAIDLWADADSGVVLRAESQWRDNRLRRFELIESSTLPEQWYQHSERAPGREVMRLEATP